jgi:proteasome assembly chaperone (PAC2) family protein
MAANWLAPDWHPRDLAELNLTEQPDLQDSVVIAAWAGWPDAAESATRAVRELIRQLRAVKFASIDPEQFYVFTDHRPVVSNGPREMRTLTWPSNELFYYRAPDGGRNVLLIVGEEPDLRWGAYTGYLSSVAKTNGAKLLVTVGALLDSVPHTRPPRVMGTSTVEMSGTSPEKSLESGVPSISYPKPNYEGPSGITSAAIDAFSKHDIPAVSIWGHAPHYLQVAYNPAITLAILRELQRFVPAELHFTVLEKQAEEFHENLVKALGDQRELAAYVQKLEERFDTEEEARDRPEPRELMAELEEFLRSERDPIEEEGEEDTVI